MTSTEDSTQAAHHAIARLAAHIPRPECELNFNTPFELLAATILSAQCTDARVNQVTPVLFERYRTVADLADADIEELETIIHSTGFYRAKAKNLLGCATSIMEDHAGQMPEDLPALCRLPGVGRKTANLVMGVAFGQATGIVIDTHASRVSQRLGLTSETKPDKIEAALMKLAPKDQWIDLGHRLILHGRHTCKSKKPDCDHCDLYDACPKIGVS
jgi:endonuclease-3